MKGCSGRAVLDSSMPLEIVLKAVTLLLREDPSSTAPHGETRCQVNRSGVSGGPDLPGGSPGDSDSASDYGRSFRQTQRGDLRLS